MSEPADFKSLFKAAKSARGGAQKLSKEQIKALKAQRAAALASQVEERPVEQSSAQATGSDDDVRSMPPPPPRQPSTKVTQPSTASFHADSQATRMNNGSMAVPSAHPEPSVNQGWGDGATMQLSSRSNALLSEEVRSSHTEGVPAGFFQSNAASGAASTSPQPEAQQRQALEAAAFPPPQQQEAAISWEGSTGAVASGNVGTDLTSAVSHQTPPQAQPSAISGVPARFFEDAGVVSSSLREQASGGAGVASPQRQAGPLPKGFFQDQAADAKARGEVPKSKKDLDKEFTDFLKQVDVDAAEAAAKKAKEDADDAATKQDREEFEHIVRLQRIEDLKRKTGEEQPADEWAARAAAAVTNPEVSVPAIQLPKKRRVADIVAELERNSMSEDDSEDGGDELLDWRAKKSAF